MGEEESNRRHNLFWTMCSLYSPLSGRFCLPHFMAPINVNVVHHTAAKEGYGGLEYRERMGGLPRGPLSIFGLIPTVLGLSAGFFLSWCVPLPYFSTIARMLRDKINTPLQKKVRNQVFDAFRSTGKTYAHGLGISQSGKCKVDVKLHSAYDPGLGFTMLCSCTVAAQIALRNGTPESAK